MAVTCVGLNPAVDRTVESRDFRVGAVCTGRLLRMQPAGKATNVARVLARLGTPCRLTGFLGESDIELYRRSFVGLPVDLSPLPVSGMTRINTTIVDPDAETETHLREAGFHITPEDFDAFSEMVENDLVPGDTAVFSGSLPPGCEADATVRLMQRLEDAGVIVVADCSGPLLRALRERPPALLKLNREEFSEFLQTPLPDHASLVRSACAYARNAATDHALLLSDGRRGAGVFSATAALWGTLDAPEVRNTVGAGDALLAGWLSAVAAGKDVEGCLRQALASGASAVGSLVAGEVDAEAVLRSAPRAAVGNASDPTSDSR